MIKETLYLMEEKSHRNSVFLQPLFLNEISVARSPEEQSNDAFHVTHNDKTFSLRAISHAER